jgi:hypothetical protein
MRKNKAQPSLINEEEIFHNGDAQLFDRMHKDSNSVETETLGGDETEQLYTDMQEHVLIVRDGSKGRDAANETLVEYNMDLSQLKGYMNNIIEVVNQHAKLLHTINNEI